MFQPLVLLLLVFACLFVLCVCFCRFVYLFIFIHMINMWIYAMSRVSWVGRPLPVSLPWHKRERWMLHATVLPNALTPAMLMGTPYLYYLILSVALTIVESYKVRNN